MRWQPMVIVRDEAGRLPMQWRCLSSTKDRAQPVGRVGSFVSTICCEWVKYRSRGCQDAESVQALPDGRGVGLVVGLRYRLAGVFAGCHLRRQLRCSAGAF